MLSLCFSTYFCVQDGDIAAAELARVQQQVTSVQQQLTDAEREIQRQAQQLRNNTDDRNRLQVNVRSHPMDSVPKSDVMGSGFNIIVEGKSPILGKAAQIYLASQSAILLMKKT